MKIRRELIVVLFVVFSALFAASCLKDDSEENQSEHDVAFNLMKQHFGITESDNIGDNIYVHFTDIPDNQDGLVVADGNGYVVVDYVGVNSDMEVFDATRKADAENSGLYRNDVIYGPERLKVSQTFVGFYKGIQHVMEGGSAVILIPHDQAFLDYEPLAYEVTVYRVFEDIDEYNQLQIDAYMDSLGITVADSFPGVSGAYYKITAEGDSVPSLDIGDSVTVKLYGYYVEADTAYVDTVPGRQFFPINESGDEVTFALGDVIFPVTEIVNYSVEDMKLGETREVISPAEYGYGAEGFHHPYVGVYIIPPSMPLHYKLTFVDYQKMNK